MIPTKEEWNRALEARHGKELHRAFSCATVAVCGLGGLGSNIAIALARAGVGRLILCDFDRVDITNLPLSSMFRIAGSLVFETIKCEMLLINIPEAIIAIIASYSLKMMQ